jgi:phage protein U
MLGLLGTSVIGVDPLTGPTRDSEDVSARFARHDLVRGPASLQDLGNEAAQRQLRFFFDETFCEPEAELQNLRRAFEGRSRLRLLLDQNGFKSGVYLIERMRIERQKMSATGRMTRVDIEVELLETSSSLGAILEGAASLVRALNNPSLRRKS